MSAGVYNKMPIPGSQDLAKKGGVPVTLRRQDGSVHHAQATNNSVPATWAAITRELALQLQAAATPSPTITNGGQQT